MKKIQEVLSRVEIPPMARMVRNIPDDTLPDAVAASFSALEESGIAGMVTPGMRIAVAAGSRGIAGYPAIMRACIDWFRAKGAVPFIVPAMGSHGGATAQGQVALLAGLGVTEESAGCPIRASMDVVKLGELGNGLGVYMDRIAHDEADGVFVLNRVKPHTNFRGKWESGLVKMLAIGLGKHTGADSCHSHGFQAMAENMPAMAAVVLERASILGGLAVVENAMDKTCRVEAVPAAAMFDRDAGLLEFARTRMPSLPFDSLDVLVVEEMGKNISGSGMDPNVLGRYSVPHMSGGPAISRIVVLDLTDASHGNAIGMGLADFIPWRFRDKIDFEAGYINSLTSTTTRGSYMPLALPTDRDAIRAAIKTCNVTDSGKLRMARIKNTLELGSFSVTPCMVEELLARGCEIAGPAEELAFSANGSLVPRNV